eukprot:TRINITY_DN44521_c0_g1_i1.p1 TRINITY_DN44521_c0_g1~~TRINITY_DN44521_c0_g1_i1.p1  ORF type:complete len:423 (-),score=85.17 TRINITY_DN44521_c0_g1_i1:504-1772(-)
MGACSSCNDELHAGPTEEVCESAPAQNMLSHYEQVENVDLQAETNRILEKQTAAPESLACDPATMVAGTPQRADAGNFIAQRVELEHDKVKSDKLDYAKKNAEEIIREATAAASSLLEGLLLDKADDVLASALHELEHVRADETGAKKLRDSDTFQAVCHRLGQYQAACTMLGAEGFKPLWEKEGCKLELKMDGSRKWFDYRLTVEIPESLSQVMASNEETDLAHKAQPQLSEPVQQYGDLSPWLKTFMLKLSIAFFQVEIVQECIRYRGSEQGFLLEAITSEFDQAAVNVPEKAGWRVVRPWTYVANLWMPRKDGKTGTVLTQVTRVDIGMSVPQWVLNTVFWTFGGTFVEDIRKSARTAGEPGSPWQERMKTDKDSFYAELAKLEKARQCASSSLSDIDAVQRTWKLSTVLPNTIPPSCR